jgi:ubiquinone/menaquinone biosynthesis C-methylase UbiE
MTHLTRYTMYKQIKERLIQNHFFPLKGSILGISGIDNFHPFIDFDASIIEEVHYPEADIQDLPYHDETYDVIISDQVIEHIENPQKAIRESYRVIKKGGLSIHTTCFINYIHTYPVDFWRFTPDALRFLCRDFDQVLDCSGWGNRIAILICLLRDKFRSLPIPESSWSIRNCIAKYNESRYPIVTWIIAKK